MFWNYNESNYTEKSFKPIPEGDHRVRISDVSEETFSNGKNGLKITLDVSGHNSKLWYYITLDPADRKSTDQRLGELFNCFNITENERNSLEPWIGKYGAVRVKHDLYEGRTIARVAFCLSRDQHDRLPTWQDKPVADQKKPTNCSDFISIDSKPYKSSGWTIPQF